MHFAPAAFSSSYAQNIYGFRRLVERQFRVDCHLYLTDDGKLRPAPRWATVIAVVDGARY